MINPVKSFLTHGPLFPEVVLIKSVKMRADVPFLYSDRPLWMSILGR